MAGRNLHASALIVGDRGVLITGASGTGKTTLALSLVARFGAQGRFARLVADDQVFLAGSHGRLLCTAPASIAGLAEVRCAGPRPLPSEWRMVVDLVVRLVPEGSAPRFQEDRTERLEGILVASAELPARNVEAAHLALASRFGLAPFR